jgi:DNA-binding protein Fis
MKNLLLIGDSIRAGYDKSVRKSLEGRVNVIFPDENCRFASYVLRHFHEWLGGVNGEDIDVVHWNTGLWDTIRMFDEEPQTPIDVYAYYIDRVCQRLKKTYPNAKIIFATSTSVQSEKMPKDFKRYNEDIENYKIDIKTVNKYVEEKIIDMLLQQGISKTKIAEILGISRTALWKKYNKD